MSIDLTRKIAITFVLIVSGLIGSRSEAQDKKPSEKASNSTTDTDSTSNRHNLSAVTIAEDLAGSTKRLELDSSRLGAMRTYRSQIQYWKDELSSAEIKTSIQTIGINYKYLIDLLKTPPDAAPTVPRPIVPGPPSSAPSIPQASPTTRLDVVQPIETRPDLAVLSPATQSRLFAQRGYAQQLQTSLSSIVRSRQSLALNVSGQLNSIRNSISVLGSSPTTGVNYAFGNSPPYVSANSPIGNLSPQSVGPMVDSAIGSVFPYTYWLLVKVLDGQGGMTPLPEDIRQAETEMNNLEEQLKLHTTRDLEKKADELLATLNDSISAAEVALEQTQRDKISLTAELKARDSLVSQSDINKLLVFAVYGMIGSIALLFVGLRIIPETLARTIVQQRLLIEVLSMGFLLLTVIILGTGKLLQSEGLAALLGTIAGYIFARKAEELKAQPSSTRSDPAAESPAPGGLVALPTADHRPSSPETARGFGTLPPKVEEDPAPAAPASDTGRDTAPVDERPPLFP